ncbi:DUF4395 domain-containing protein [Actinotalea sp. M2MS4P-6]|uniref:DUF4395 domain-containing protein n=1 Tax=Actinotalea sp. M2MS4P-6 TaxID=2983762 RepID=UPI0021E4F124|nr:DUF4395 domain-containing protein [Actinotalea sp. M2MS4P-6]MCV2396286.1 DUF4395 domain-containing protein [Actinotalea sp. M2MS4P-6]
MSTPPETTPPQTTPPQTTPPQTTPPGPALAGSATTTPVPAAGIDPRGPRAGAAVTSALLAGVLLLGDGAAGRALLGLVVLLFASGVLLGPARSVLGVAYRRLVAPRLRPTTEREDPRPPRFAQVVGLLVAGTGLALALLGVPGALVVATALAFVAAFLNAAFGVCLGCELYLIGLRLRTRRA